MGKNRGASMVPALPDEIRRGRTSRWRHVALPQWALLMTDLSDAALRVYALLLAHVNAADGDGEAWPQQQSMAAMLGRHRNSIGRAIKELSEMGLIDVEVERYGTNNSRRRNIYIVHELPPEGHDGPASIAEWYAAHPRPEPEPINRRDRKTAGHPGRTKNSASGGTNTSASGDTANCAGINLRRNEPKEEEASSSLLHSAPQPAVEAGTKEEEKKKQEKKEEQQEQQEGAVSAERLVASALRFWDSAHTRPSAPTRRTLVARVAQELAAGADPDAVLAELVRDLHPSQARSAVRVVMARTRVPGWAQGGETPARLMANVRPAWCGVCDEATRHLVEILADGRDQVIRCPRCHPVALAEPAEIPTTTPDHQEPQTAVDPTQSADDLRDAHHHHAGGDEPTGGTGGGWDLPAPPAAPLGRDAATDTVPHTIGDHSAPPPAVIADLRAKLAEIRRQKAS